MVDLDQIAMLLALEEKLRGHPHLADIKIQVDRALLEHNAAAKAENSGEPEPAPVDEPPAEEPADAA